jgi:hypothetical protein
VRDPLGASGTTTVVVAPGNHTPQLTLTTPGDAATFAVSQQVSLSGTATDAEDGVLPITWTSAVRHCPSEATCHSHPDVGGTGAGFAAPFTAHPDSRMEFTATVTDSAGVTTSKTYVAWPREHRITLVGTQPAALSIPVEGGVNTAVVTEGATFDVEAAPLGIDGVSKFTGWQGGPTGTTWIVTVGSTDLTLTANYATPIDQRYDADAALRTKLGAPTAAEVTDGTVHYRTYASGRLYWSAVGGTKYVVGPVLDKYVAFGGHAKLGPPTSDTASTPDGVAQFNHFDNNGNVGSVYSTAATGAHAIFGEIRKKWAALGYERGLGYPTTDEAGTPDGAGRYNHFVKGANIGSIYYTVPTGAHAIFGEIRKKWAALDYERGLGYPTTDEVATPDGVGRYNHFSLGHSVYYTVATGAHAVKGEIRKRWAALGWERSYLGYPTTDEYVTNGVYRSDFQGGYITFTLAGGAVDRPW